MALSPDMKYVKIFCTDRFHEEKMLVNTSVVRYVRGQPKPPELIAAGDAAVRLFQNKALYGDKNWGNPDKNKQGLTDRAQKHFEKLGQLRTKINLYCRCGQNVSFKTHEPFLEYVQLAIDNKIYVTLDNKIYEIPIDFFRRLLSSK